MLLRMTGTAWSQRQIAARVFRTPPGFSISAGHVTMVTGGACGHDLILARRLAVLHGPSR